MVMNIKQVMAARDGRIEGDPTYDLIDSAEEYEQAIDNDLRFSAAILERKGFMSFDFGNSIPEPVRQSLRARYEDPLRGGWIVEFPETHDGSYRGEYRTVILRPRP